MSTGERRVCLLTGASGTLGDAFCQAYYRDYDIVAVCRTRTPAVPSQLEWYVDPLAPEAAVPENDARVFVVRSDLTEPGEVERVVDLALARFGRVDLLVNNAAHVRLHPPRGRARANTSSRARLGSVVTLCPMDSRSSPERTFTRPLALNAKALRFEAGGRVVFARAGWHQHAA
ncbi:SDR family NAD(P)-dependent oxidoreductase, partial [Nocardia gipuzkoensis]|uniref:SDR family NAD(P)-dependent oxidoreductase n=1 Tax=Nocardia gipuzkoensis TaxID=2749991 RepID=UPI002454257B